MTQPINERVRVSLGEDGVAEVRLNRPDKLNAVDPAMIAGIVAAQDRLREDRNVRAVVLCGEGRGFCAGLDMTAMGALAAGDDLGLMARTHGQANAPQQTAWGWRTLPVPVIAAVHGPAFGAGFQIALGADVRCVAPDAKLSAMEVKWGLVPDMAGVALLRELVRADVARELVFTGRVVDGSEAAALGLATWVGDDPFARARALAAEIAAKSPDAVRAAKRLFNQAFDLDAAGVLAAEAREQSALIGGLNQREAIMAGLQKRPPAFGPAEG
ncbi:crotonase/enoyl-CoA hydratase family protein [Caulobacter sp. 17J80-11]|uniref:crotonase/enoyl-CoA hydratase family protein n=1 Tax=Caulobacter sp. 17J80-11 TaxID=2763502 RepID=UPI0016535E05|nr:crotonase/enoyl-CoA hydratase family protein [Caulobacter sp. 17J80-11]MBC6982159.1 crotonase/enoyl-CoA hydratase family protein [Caulobacter sp. 17J80-11]